MNRGVKNLRDISYTADAGLQAVLPHGSTVNPAPRIGFTQPIAIYERMRALYANAQRLDADMIYVSDTAFVAGWGAWFATYKALYEKYAGPNASNTAKVIVLWRTDEFSDEIAKREAEFQSWLVDYNRQRKPDGSLVPQVTPLADPNAGGTGWGIPWWFWMLTGLAAGGAALLVYKKYNEGKAKVAYAKKNFVPRVLDKYVPGFGEDIISYSNAGRDYSESDAPSRFDLDYYANRGRQHEARTASYSPRDRHIESDVIRRYRDE